MKSAINDVRINLMGLEVMSPAWWLSQYNRMGVPCSYLWSPRLLPKPGDWADNVRVTGFVFEEVPEGFAPPADLVAFLEAKASPPVYVGFGSMSFANAKAVFENVFEALRRIGARAVVCTGWSKVEGGIKGEEGRVFVVDEVPHAWLFPRVRAVVCHGGAGTTAMALRCGRPTLIVPVAGDQPLWGSRVSAAGFGVAEADAGKFEKGIRELLGPGYAAAAERLAEGIAAERPGEEVCVEEILGTARVYEVQGRCDFYGGRPAVWRTGRGDKVSAVAAHVLVEAGRLGWGDLRALEVVKWPDLVSPGDPVTGVVLGAQQALGSCVADVKAKDWGRLGAHVLRAPLTILAAVAFGLFNLLDFILYELGSPFHPKLYASNPRLYTYPQMLGFLLSAPLVEIGSVVGQPARLARQGRRGMPRVVLEVLLAILRVLIALFNLPVGFAGITLRHVDVSWAKAMGERPVADVVAEARIRQGRVEAERLSVEGAEGGRDVVGGILKRWDGRRGA
ncbi:Sterol 3-beta-glucosyltransferase UGT80A2-like protein 1 [Colletotrichum chlorophyti]|uniref:Sterol 3-beta-glucosyltransferase UGT80A2-like protein 1 n=1 Tax=Colletotrichum chlorophyti TaxID=708187 RepID=A0A1Q8RN33_9PEZI|nr:Sterol 3-beta-glucosyltransferase UGT80A2-like protein 1 [Colletotrichum chlorophyti]